MGRSTLAKTLLLHSIVLIFIAAAWPQAVSTSQISGIVRDPSGSAVAGAEVRATQTETGLVRTVTSGEDGSYLLTNLPVGPYQLRVIKSGFQSYVQSGIVLQVSSNPAISVTLKVGSLNEVITVQSDAAMVETQNTAVGQVIDQKSIVELPLNGRQATQLIFLAGAATPAPVGDLNTNKNYPTVTISVTGSLPNGIEYLMDGGTHNDPFNNLNLPLPFPDALQEFKVETNSLPARYGQHAAAAVNAVTKSGTNQIHGNAFEFVRNYIFNARDYFAATRDSLKRNQFGGTIGGPILKDRLFFFAGYQGTIVRSNPPTITNFVPTQAMLNGDFTAFASAACQGGTAKTLKAPFVNNQVSPTLFNQQALNLLTFIPLSTNPCGKIQYGILDNNREHQILGRIDYRFSAKNSLYGRYFIGNYSDPVVPVHGNALLANKAGVADQDQTFVLGDTFVLNSTTVNSLHATLLRTRGFRQTATYFSPADLGVNVFSPIAGFTGITIAGGLNLGTAAINPGYFNSTDYQFADDIDFIRGSHQISVGADFIRSIMHTTNNRPTNGQFTFDGSFTGLGYGDFLLGDLQNLVQGNQVFDADNSNYIGVYAQDSWKIKSRLTLNYGVRWEPFIPEINSRGFAEGFDLNRFIAGVHSTVNSSAPAGLLLAGDPRFSGKSDTFGNKHLFAPRVGLVWDPRGNGRMTVRAGYGMFYDTPQLFFNTRVANNPPWGAQVSLTSPAGGFTNPYAGQPGGNPFPGGSFFPANGVYVTLPTHTKPMYLEQYNLSLQEQVGANTLLSATYIGHHTVHLPTGNELDPAVFGPGATGANTNPRRVLRQINPTDGAFYSTIGALDDGGTASYNGLLLSAQRRFATNFSALANWTWSHCIGDPETTELTGPTYIGSKSAFRSNCSSDRRHVVNVSVVATSPKFSNGWANHLAGNWELSTIFRYLTGDYETVLAGRDSALNGIGIQTAVRVLPDPFMPHPTAQQYLNPAAFAFPAAGTLSSMRPLSVVDPNEVVLDMGISRYFLIHESQRLQFKWEVFNVPNHANFPPPTANLNSPSTFGKIFGVAATQGAAPTSLTGPRIMQFALKYEF